MQTYAGRPVAPAQLQQQQPFNWVQGFEVAKSYPVAPGNTAILFDTEKEVFYVKSVDQNGFPLPLIVNEYKDVTDQYVTPIENKSDYVTEDKLNELLDKKFDALLEKIGNNGYRKQYNNNYKKGMKENEQSLQ